MVTVVTWPTVVGIKLIIVMASFELMVKKETNERIRCESLNWQKTRAQCAQLVHLIKISSIKLQQNL